MKSTSDTLLTRLSPSVTYDLNGPLCVTFPYLPDIISTLLKYMSDKKGQKGLTVVFPQLPQINDEEVNKL